MKGPLRLAALLLGLGALGALGALASPAEIYGKPLRGLSAVPIPALLASPDRYAGKSVRVAGTGRKGAGGLEVAEGEAALKVVPEGFALPDSALGARWTVEGKVRADGGPPLLTASGIEVSR